ncbi:MAG: retroviral-like aspartic protease family protein [Chloroflexi bacterium]|nr:retroviral-like aspartic protease family protein [Chloroflexota bacterium]
MSSPYNSSYVPAMPTLVAAFGHGGERPWLGPLDAVIDTGADATIVPEVVLQQLRAIPLNPGQLESQWGDVHPLNIYLVDIEVAQQILPGVVVAGDPATDEIVLGRNVLNKLPLFLDGPKQQTEVLDDAAIQRLRSRR